MFNCAQMDLQEKQAEVVKTISTAEKAIGKLQSNNVEIEVLYIKHLSPIYIVRQRILSPSHAALILA